MIHFKTPPNSVRIRHRQIQIQIQQRLLCFSEKPLLFFSLPLPKSQKSPKFGRANQNVYKIANLKLPLHLHCTFSKICSKVRKVVIGWVTCSGPNQDWGDCKPLLTTFLMNNNRAAGTYEDIRTGPHHVFRIQLTLSQPGGQIMPTTVLQSSPC